MSDYHLLINKFIEKTISSEDRKVLELWVLENDANEFIFKNHIKNSSKESAQDFDADLAYLKFSETIKAKNNVPNKRYAVLKYAAVIAILLTTGFFVIQQFSNTVTNATISVVNKQTVIPDGNEIIIKLADGTQNFNV